MATCPVCFPAVVSGPVCSVLVGSGSICSALVGPGPVCSALVGSGSVCPTLVGPRSICSALEGFSPVGSALVGSSPLCSALGGFSPVCSTLVGSSPLCSALVGSRSVCSALGASVRSALPWWAPVPSSPPWLPHGPGPPSLPLFRLRSTAHLDLCRSVWKPLLGGGGYVTNRGHEHCSTHHQRSLFHHRTFTQLQITLRLHFPSFTAPTQLFTIITLAPVHHHPITHTHYINPGPSATLCRVLFSPATLRSVFPVFLV